MNRGRHLYNVSLNVTIQETEWISQHVWHKMGGHPVNKKVGKLFEIVASWRKPNEVLYSNTGMIPLELNHRCVAFAQVDTEDHDELNRFKWVISDQGYAVFFNTLLNSTIAMHRFVMNFPEGKVVDHIRWNRLDNRKEMLRECSVAENNRNMSYKRK